MKGEGESRHDKIRVFILDDSPVVINVLSQLIQRDASLVLVGTALDAKVAIEKIPILKPDVICADFHMKGMNGLEFTTWIMKNFPTPILIVTVGVNNVFELLQAGAIDVIRKPSLNQVEQYTAKNIIQKIKLIAGVKVVRRIDPKNRSISLAPVGTCDIIGIGASTGGPKIVASILRSLPGNFPIPIVCSQHISPGFLQGLVDWMNRECRLRVKIADDTEPLTPGVVYYAPEQSNLEIVSHRIRLSPRQPNQVYCPSINIMFESLVRYQSRALAIILSGMGDDGAKGLLAVRKAQGVTIAQDEHSCIIYGMPKVAVELGAAQKVCTVEQIALHLQQFAYQTIPSKHK